MGCQLQLMRLTSLDLSFEEVSRQTPEQQFRTLQAALADVENPTQRAALAQQLLGRAGKELIPLINEGAEGLQGLEKQAEATGNVMTAESAGGFAKFNDTWNTIKNSVSGLIQTLVTAFLPAINKVASFIQNNLVKFINEKVIPALRGEGGLGKAFQIVGKIIDGVAKFHQGHN